MTLKGLWTNTSKRSDFVQNGLSHYQPSVSQVFIAVAFFTEESVIRDMVANDCHVRLIVRLGFPTSPKALKALIDNSNVEIRYFTDTSFHPKLYIFGDRVALVGSANLTNSAIFTNQEVVVSIESTDSRFNELTSLFSNFWDESQVLTNDAIDGYQEIYDKYGSVLKDIKSIEDETEKKIGKSVFSNIGRGKQKRSKENIFLESYQKTYQEAVTGYRKIKQIYESVGKRKNNNSNNIPIRVEIDSFFSFIRDVHATHETWKDRPLGWLNNQSTLLLTQIDEWLETDYPHFDETITFTNYPLITELFKSKQSINSADYDSIIEALVVLHSFHDRLRFYSGGLDTLKKVFKEGNELSKVRSSFCHLLFGGGDIIKRMADLLYDETYKLSNFGESNVQELVGWVNNEDLPVINGRTTKVLRYYGFDVRQL